MAQIRGNLVNVNDVLGPLDVIDHIGTADVNAAVSLTLAAGSVGTVVLEVSPGQDATDTDIWQQVVIYNPQPGVDAKVNSLAGSAAVSYAWAELVGARKVRARKTVAGPGNAFVLLNMKAS